MLSKRESEGIKAILKKLDNLALASLAGTVTKNMVKAETRNEAISVILTYSENAFTLLHRRKIKKEILFHYLKDNGIPAPPSSEKAKFVMACLTVWESNIDYDNISEMEDMEDSDDSSTPVSEASSYNKTVVEPLSEQQNIMCEVTLQQPRAVERTHITNNLDIMGQEFVTWFYGLLDRINIESGNLHSEHFWPDCIMQLQINATDLMPEPLAIQSTEFNSEQAFNKAYTEQILGSQNVTDKLIKLVINENLIFRPNSNQYGVSCYMERHGLIKILASGVLYRANLCIGLFDQIFGLVRNANNENNWKIKYMELLLKVKYTNSLIES